MIMPFDEMNILNQQKPPRSIPIKRYFREMDLPEEEIEDREEFAEDLKDTLFYILALIFTLLDRGMLTNIASVKLRLSDRIRKLVEKYTYPDSYMLEYIDKYSSDFVDTTVKNADKYSEDEKVAYWFSEDRALYNAENETNTIFNYEQFRQATLDGFTQKQWVTMRDERVRLTHADIDGVIVPIDGFFEVGGYLMRYPKDRSLGAGPEEIINCRCTVRYF